MLDRFHFFYQSVVAQYFYFNDIYLSPLIFVVIPAFPGRLFNIFIGSDRRSLEMIWKW